MSLTKDFSFESWDDFKWLFRERLDSKRMLRLGAFLFRGQGDANWPLETSFNRKFRGDNSNKLYSDLEKNFKDFCRPIKKLKDIRENSQELFSLGQHYGLTSRLLDWTESPYIAAFFAFHGALERAAQSNINEINANRDSVAVWAVDIEDDKFWEICDCYRKEEANKDKSENNKRVIITRASLEHNERLYNQMGWFTVQQEIAEPLDQYIDQEYGNSCKGPAFWRFIIPLRDVVEGMADLDLMGINAARLYGSDEGRAIGALDRTIINSLSG